MTEMSEPEPMSVELLRVDQGPLDEPPPLIALAERTPNKTVLEEYLTRLMEDRISLVDEVDRLLEQSLQNANRPDHSGHACD